MKDIKKNNSLAQLMEDHRAALEVLNRRIEKLEDHLKIESLRKGKFLALIAPLVDEHIKYPEEHLEGIKIEARYKMRMFNWCFECNRVCCEGDCHV